VDDPCTSGQRARPVGTMSGGEKRRVALAHPLVA
jgi:ATPase subunit of ABC transporter with duplicated ATPase domains